MKPAIVAAAMIAAAGMARSGSRARRDPGGLVETLTTVLTGEEVFSHVTVASAADAIRRAGFRPGEGRYGFGVYLLPPDQDANEFRLRWHEHRDDMRILRVTMPAGTRLLRLCAAPSMALAELLRTLHGERGVELYREAWRLGMEKEAMLEELRAAGLSGVIWTNPVFLDDEILVVDPALLTVVREEVQRGSRSSR